jgi:hypothetical protein
MEHFVPTRSTLARTIHDLPFWGQFNILSEMLVSLGTLGLIQQLRGDMIIKAGMTFTTFVHHCFFYPYGSDVHILCR